MAAFTIDMSHPIRSGFTGHHGGPGRGGHGGSQWYIAFGMDLGAPAGTNVFAAFDGHITQFHPDRPTRPGSKQFGAEIFVRDHDNKMGCFYTHVTGVPSAIARGASLTRGAPLGSIKAFSPPHLHFAVVEIVGGLPGGRYMGVSGLFRHFVSTANTSTVHTVTFHQNGSQPTV